MSFDVITQEQHSLEVFGEQNTCERITLKQAVYYNLIIKLIPKPTPFQESIFRCNENLHPVLS
ncbi:hypothetical protein Mapa_005757 [Marchantia paleacea]|nr:hypothetical protein Mapa_005757 [Marchantia paleacea]